MKKHLILGLLFFFLIITMVGSASATTRTVGPGHTYNNISAAIKAASPGDTIKVYDNYGKPYTYIENPDVDKNNITLKAVGKVTVKPVNTSTVSYVFALSNHTTIDGFNIQVIERDDSEGERSNYIGIAVDYNCVIKNNVISGNNLGSTEGIRNFLVDGTVITNNTIYNVAECIFAEFGKNVIITHNILNSNNLAIGFEGGPSWSTVSYNTFLGKRGFFLNGGDHVKVYSNTFKNNEEAFFNAGNYNYIHNNVFNNCDVGINFYRTCIKSIISNNIITNSSSCSIYLNGSSFTDISNNNLFNNNVSIELKGAIQSNIYNNFINGGPYGILLDDLTLQTPTGNEYYGNYNNTIKGNNIINCEDCITLLNILASSSDNNITFNRIIGKYWGLVNFSNENVVAYYNWWGSNLSPKNKIFGKALYDPWLVLKIAVIAKSVEYNTSKISLKLLYDSNGVYHNPSVGHVPDGIPVTFKTTLGSITSPLSIFNGTVTTTLNGGSVTGTAKVSGRIDNQTVTTSVKLLDVIPPKISFTYPKKGEIGFSKYAIIGIRFTENIHSSIFYSGIKLKNLSTGKYGIPTKYIIGSTLYIKTPPRRANTWYQIIIPAKAIRDYTGNRLPYTYAFNFKTGP